MRRGRPGEELNNCDLELVWLFFIALSRAWTQMTENGEQTTECVICRPSNLSSVV